MRHNLPQLGLSFFISVFNFSISVFNVSISVFKTGFNTVIPCLHHNLPQLELNVSISVLPFHSDCGKVTNKIENKKSATHIWIFSNSVGEACDMLHVKTFLMCWSHTTHLTLGCAQSKHFLCLRGSPHYQSEALVLMKDWPHYFTWRVDECFTCVIIFSSCTSSSSITTALFSFPWPGRRTIPCRNSFSDHTLSQQFLLRQRKS